MGRARVSGKGAAEAEPVGASAKAAARAVVSSTPEVLIALRYDAIIDDSMTGLVLSNLVVPAQTVPTAHAPPFRAARLGG